MKTIRIVLKTVDESYDTQSKIVDTLLKKTNLLKRNVVDVDESEIKIEIMPNLALANRIKQVVLGDYESALNVSQCVFCGGDGPDGTVGDRTPSGGTDAPQGFGNANLRGTTVMSGPEKGKKYVNVDRVLHDQTQYTAEACPQIQYCDGESIITLPATQEQFSVGVMTPKMVANLNKQFQDMWSDILSSDYNNNEGNPTTVERAVQVDNLKPQHQTLDGLKNSNADKDDYIRSASEARGADARDPERVPVANMLIKDLGDVIKHGERSDMRTLPKLNTHLPECPKIQSTELPTVKSELVQRLLAFSTVDDMFEDVFSITSRIATGVATGVAAKVTTEAVANKMGASPETAKSAGNKMGMAAAMNQKKIMSTIKKPFK